MMQHTFELSKSLNPSFDLGEIGEGAEISMLELSLLCGVMVHLMSTFSIADDGTSLHIEWLQKYPM